MRIGEPNNRNIRRGDLMDKEYWQQFTATGRVEDYLRYRMETEGVKNRESDCTDRDGAVNDSYRGV